MTELAWVPFVVLLLVFGAYVAENWPRHDPTDDRRYQAHFRRPTTRSGLHDLAGGLGTAVSRDAGARSGSPVDISPRGRSG